MFRKRRRLRETVAYQGIRIDYNTLCEKLGQPIEDWTTHAMQFSKRYAWLLLRTKNIKVIIYIRGETFQKDDTILDYGTEIKHREDINETYVNQVVAEARRSLYEGKSASELLRYANDKI